MGFIGVFLVSVGALFVVAATECVPETAKCSKYWVKKLPHKNLIATEEELESWCRNQDRFYECLEDIFLEGKNGNLSYLPTNLLISKLFSKDICSEGSKNRERLLNNAECINNLDTNFCILPEYLDIVTPDDAIPSTRCSQAEKTFSCIAATIVLNCGFDAGRVYRAMLKITRYSDEVCGIEVSDGIPPCEGSYSKSVDREKKLSEIYYGLFHRIGNLLDEQNDFEDLVSDEPSELGNEAINEAIQSAIDHLDANVVSEVLDSPEHDSNSQSSCTKDVKDYKPYMKNPQIAEVVKGIFFYNYSGIEYALYWRQPEFVVFNQTVCTHLLPSYSNFTVFQCRTDYRYEDPDCVSNATVHEKVTPEFIRNFDPEVPCDSTMEFGPRPDWVKEIDEIFEEKRLRDQMSTASSVPTTPRPMLVTASAAILNVVSVAETEKFWDNLKKNFYKYDIFAAGFNSLFPNEIHKELMDALRPGLEKGEFVPPTSTQIRVGDSMYVIWYNVNRTEHVENFTCSRIDECHPKGKGVWKCKWYPRQIETCDNCEVKIKIPLFSDARPRYARPRYARPFPNSTLNKDATEPSVRVEPSTLESETLTDESITLVFSGDDDPERNLVVNHFEDSERINELDLMMDEAYSEDELKDSDKNKYNLYSDSDLNEVQLQLLNSMFDKDEDSVAPRLVYAIHDTDTEDDSSEIISTDGLLAGDIILVNPSDLEGTEYTVVDVPPDFSE